jgi:hypothetical protein
MLSVLLNWEVCNVVATRLWLLWLLTCSCFVFGGDLHPKKRSGDNPFWRCDQAGHSMIHDDLD